MMAPSLDILIGTKAQYIKTAPLLRNLAESGVLYRLIDTGQHAKTAADLRRFLDIKEPDVILQDEGNVKTVGQAARWFLRHLLAAVFRPTRLRQEIFSPGAGIVVIHGDTPSTLLGLLMAKRAGKKVAHLEAGLRSHNPLRPFPEEIIRIVTMKTADVLFAPSDWAEANLRKLKVRGRVVNVRQNTNVEALHWSLARGQLAGDIPSAPFCVVTFHRVETIMSRRRLTFMIEVMRRVAADVAVVFVRHDPTERKLADFGLLDEVRCIPNLFTCPLLDHPSFLKLLQAAEFVLTDGGSIQEECSYLDKPCLVMRKETERQEGLDGPVRLCGFDHAEVSDFLAQYAGMRTGRAVANLEPSRVIAGILQDELLKLSQARGHRAATR